MTVDTPEFGALLTRLNMCAGQKEIDRTRSDIIRSADAHTARAVAAAVKATHEQSMRDAAEIVAAERSAQPVAGELPPLPETNYNACGDGSEPLYTPDMMQAYVLADRAKRAAQPVQQPAPIDPLDLVGALREFAGDGGYSHNDYADTMRQAADEIERLKVRHPVAVVGQEPIGTLARNRSGTDESLIFTPLYDFHVTDGMPIYTAPVPAAGVQPVCDVCSGYGAYGDGPFTQKCNACNTPPPAAGVQGDAWKPSGLEYDHAIHSNPDAKAWADLFVQTHPALADKHDLMLGWFANAMMAMYDHLYQTKFKDWQPDSGRDAALVLLQDAARAWNNERESELDSIMERIEIFLIQQRAAHPAPSSDGQAAIPEFFHGDEITCCNEHGHIYRATVKKVEARWPADRKAYFYYHVAVPGDSKTVRIPSSEITPECRAERRAANPAPSSDAALVDLIERTIERLSRAQIFPLVTEWRKYLAAHPANGAQAGGAISQIIDHIADNWPMKKYALDEIEDRLRAFAAAKKGT